MWQQPFKDTKASMKEIVRRLIIQQQRQNVTQNNTQEESDLQSKTESKSEEQTLTHEETGEQRKSWDHCPALNGPTGKDGWSAAFQGSKKLPNGNIFE